MIGILESKYSAVKYIESYRLVLEYALDNGITMPSDEQNQINNLRHKKLHQVSALTEFDNLWFFDQVADLDFKRINQSNPDDYYLTNVSASPQNADGGIYASATNQALNTNYQPSVDAVKCLKLDGSCVWKFYNIPTIFDVARNIFGARVGNDTQQTLFANSANNAMITRMNGSDTSPTAVGIQASINIHNHKCDIEANAKLYRNGVQQGATGTNITAGTLCPLNIVLLGFNANGVITSTVGAGLAYVGFGSNLEAEQLAIYNALN